MEHGTSSAPWSCDGVDRKEGERFVLQRSLYVTVIGQFLFKIGINDMIIEVIYLKWFKSEELMFWGSLFSSVERNHGFSGVELNLCAENHFQPWKICQVSGRVPTWTKLDLEAAGGTAQLLEDALEPQKNGKDIRYWYFWLLVWPVLFWTFFLTITSWNGCGPPNCSTWNYWIQEIEGDKFHGCSLARALRGGLSLQWSLESEIAEGFL